MEKSKLIRNVAERKHINLSCPTGAPADSLSKRTHLYLTVCTVSADTLLTMHLAAHSSPCHTVENPANIFKRQSHMKSKPA